MNTQTTIPIPPKTGTISGEVIDNTLKQSVPYTSKTDDKLEGIDGIL
jgi:hypothetical protein